MWEHIPLFVALVTAIAQVKCDVNCDEHGVLLYEEIGCKPMKDNPDDLCASRFDCSHLDEHGYHCFFQGKKYPDGEALPNGVTTESCSAGCFCHASYDAGFNYSMSQFKCAEFDCPENIGGDPLEQPGCVRSYAPDKCCATGQICPPFDDIASCKVDGKIRREGEKFYPKDTCSSCVCLKDFKGKYEPPFCKRQFCGAEIRHTQDIRAYCAPLYENERARCCPILWICPSESDTFIPAPRIDPFAKVCKFGDREIRSGRVLERTVEKYGKKYYVKCDCQLPPLLTCVVEKSEWLKD